MGLPSIAPVVTGIDYRPGGGKQSTHSPVTTMTSASAASMTAEIRGPRSLCGVAHWVFQVATQIVTGWSSFVR